MLLDPLVLLDRLDLLERQALETLGLQVPLDPLALKDRKALKALLVLLDPLVLLVRLGLAEQLAQQVFLVEQLSDIHSTLIREIVIRVLAT